MTDNKIFIQTIYNFMRQYNDTLKYALSGVYVKTDADCNATIEGSDGHIYTRRVVKSDSLLANWSLYIPYSKQSLEILKLKKSDMIQSIWIDKTDEANGKIKLGINKNGQDLKIDIVLHPTFKPPFDSLEPKKLGHKIGIDFELIKIFLEANPNLISGNGSSKFTMEIDTQNSIVPIKIIGNEGEYVGVVMPMRI